MASRRFRLTLRFPIIVATALVGSLVAAPASTASRQQAERHCVIRLRPVSQVGRTIYARPVPVGCYHTQRRSMLVGTRGRVQLPPGTTSQQLTQGLIDESTVSDVAGDFLIGKEYNDTGFVNLLREYYADTGCGQNTWIVNYVGDTWNDRFESGKGFSNCDNNRKFEHADLAGASLPCTPNCSTYGVLNNEVSSLRWRN